MSVSGQYMSGHFQRLALIASIDVRFFDITKYLFVPFHSIQSIFSIHLRPQISENSSLFHRVCFVSKCFNEYLILIFSMHLFLSENIFFYLKLRTLSYELFYLSDPLTVRWVISLP